MEFSELRYRDKFLLVAIIGVGVIAAIIQLVIARAH
jgi:hypothetical protein